MHTAGGGGGRRRRWADGLRRRRDRAEQAAEVLAAAWDRAPSATDRARLDAQRAGLLHARCVRGWRCCVGGRRLAVKMVHARLGTPAARGGEGARACGGVCV